MAKAWSDVENSAQYKNLSDADKTAAKQQYFDTVVVPRAQAQNAPLDQVRAQFFGNTSEKPMTWSQAGVSALENTPESAFNFVKNTYETFRHPVKTAGTVLDVAAGEIQKALPKGLVDSINKIDPNAAAGKQAVDAATQFNKHFTDRYGSAEGFKRAVAKDPVGVLSDLSAIFTGGAGALGKVPELAAAAKTAGKLAEFTNPVNIPGKMISGVKTAKGALSNTPGALTQAALDRDNLLQNYNKAIKPTNAGKTGPGQLESYNNKVVSGVKSIFDNKNNLAFEDASGNMVRGQLPQTRAQFSEAIEQTKQNLFKQYNDLAKQATGQGVQISLKDSGDALQKVIDDKALQLSHPEAVNYARTLQDRFKNPAGSSTPWQSIDPGTIEKAVANYNADLKAFYKNPTYGQASRAAIDAGVVHVLRKSLGDAIESATGEQYSGLKKQYGALSAIEKDVNKSALAQLKQTGTVPSGIGKYIDVFSGGDMAAGIMSLNPALFAKGVAQKGLLSYYQWLNSPDRAVKKMFDSPAVTGRKAVTPALTPQGTDIVGKVKKAAPVAGSVSNVLQQIQGNFQ